MALSRATTQTRTALVVLIRDKAGDPATDAVGNTIAEAQRRYKDDDVDSELQQFLKWMHVEVAGDNPTQSLLVTADLTPNATTGEVDLPAPIALGGASVYKVEDVFGSITVAIEYVSPHEMDRHNLVYLNSMPGRRRYTLIGGDLTSAALRLKVIPSLGATQTVRVWYVAAPIVPGADSDVVMFSDKWEELICLGTACGLMARDDEATMQQLMRLQELKQQFKLNAPRLQGSRRIRRRRRGVS